MQYSSKTVGPEQDVLENKRQAATFEAAEFPNGSTAPTTGNATLFEGPSAGLEKLRRIRRDETNSEFTGSIPRKQTFEGQYHLFEIAAFGAVFATIIYLQLLAILSGFSSAWVMPVTVVAMVSSLSFAAFRLIRVQSQALKDKTETLANRLESIEDQSWEIRESEERYRSLAEAFGDLVVHRDLQGNVLFANEAFRRNFGDMTDQSLSLEGRRFQLDPLPDSDPGPMEFGQSEPQARDIHLDTLQGPLWFSWLDIAIRDEVTGMSAIVSVAREITDRKETEAILLDAKKRAESASRAKSRFLATVSHEIRTPLNGILGMANLLSDTELSPTQNSYVEAVKTSGKSLFSLVEDILDIAKIEAERLVLRPEKTSIHSLVEGVVELLANASHSKGLEIVSYVSPDVPARVWVDKDRLRQVILNIVNNAVKFTTEGGVLVEVTNVQACSSENMARLKFLIQDTGQGLAEEDLNKIFGEFEQVDTARNRHHNGAGLGLAISQRIIGKMGSQIHVESKLGEGSKFSFELEIPIVEAETKIQTATNLKYENILLIAPDCFERKVSANHIRDNGGKVMLCASEAEAVAVISSNEDIRPVDMVIVDCRLPLDVPAFIEQLRGLTKHPFKAVVAIDPVNRASVEEMLKQGIDGWLIRPIRARSIEENLVGREPSFKTLQKSIEDEKPSNTSALSTDTALNILLADDNKINQLLANALLERSSHSSTVVDDGRSAVDAFEQSLSASGSSFDLILMDLHMPDMDGIEAIGKIRAIEASKGLLETPILVLSADEQDEVRIAAKEVGANGFVSKPIDAEQLGNAVRLAIGENEPDEPSICDKAS